MQTTRFPNGKMSIKEMLLVRVVVWKLWTKATSLMIL